jgi:hypothetical protein
MREKNYAHTYFYYFIKILLNIIYRLQGHQGAQNLEARLKRGPSTSAAADAAEALNNPPSFPPPPPPPNNDFVEIELVFFYKNYLSDYLVVLFLFILKQTCFIF